MFNASPASHGAAMTYRLDAAPGDWAALHAQAYTVWHRLTHAQAGRRRVGHAQLCLSTAWRSAGDAKVRLQRLAEFFAISGAKVEVIFVASPVPAELRLRWLAWHAPPLVSNLSAQPTGPSPVVPSPLPLNPMLGLNTMKLPAFFSKSASAAASEASAHEPQLSPQPQPPERRSGTQLPLALSQVAEHIARQEVHDLLELGMNGRYRLFTLSFWVSAANQPALRNLMEINQRDPSAARQVVKAAFAKTNSAALLDTSRLALVFTPGDNLPRDAAEVLIVCGRDTVALPYTYSGEIELPSEVVQSTPGATAHPRPAEGATGAQPSPAPLCLWLQAAQPAMARRWLITKNSTVGADPVCDVEVEWTRVSGQHLLIQPNAQGDWTVVDEKSTNGSLLLDAEGHATPGNPPEAPLIKGKITPLPRAGYLRLGGGPTDPLLHFAQLGSVRQNVASAAPPSARSRRVTELGPVVGVFSGSSNVSGVQKINL